MDSDIIDFTIKYQKFNSAIDRGMQQQRYYNQVAGETQQEVNDTFWEVFNILKKESLNASSYMYAMDLLQKINTYCNYTGINLDLMKALQEVVQARM